MVGISIGREINIRDKDMDPISMSNGDHFLAQSGAGRPIMFCLIKVKSLNRAQVKNFVIFTFH